MTEPRIWTLQPYPPNTVGAEENAAVILGAKDVPIPGQEIVRVVEAEPVAELLEETIMRDGNYLDIDKRLEALLAVLRPKTIEPQREGDYL